MYRRLLLLLALLLPGGMPLALHADEQDTAFEGFVRAPDPETAVGADADLFRRGLALQAKGRYASARRAFWKLIEEHPDSPFAPEAEDRSGPNAFLGVTLMHEPRPSERRIDVALMGDGYLFAKQARFDDHAQDHLAVLLKEPSFAEYESYFCFWRFNLASKDAGVDEVEHEPADEELADHLRRRRTRKVKTFETALDCKAAGPQGQVAANPRCVWHYLGYLTENDGLAICFAKKGELGMGGGGIATSAPRGVVVHEFGHAFTGLLDEYVNKPGPPFGFTEAANTTTNHTQPPWQHFLDARIPGVGVYEGGATFRTGVWRPAQGCAMNTGGNVFCPVCREANVLMIYTYVSPIDTAVPAARAITRSAEGAWPRVEVRPMQPATHDLEVTFFLGPEPESTEDEDAEIPRSPEDEFADEMLSDEERRHWERIRKRREARGESIEVPEDETPPPPARRRFLGTGKDDPPPGEVIRGKRRKVRGGARIHSPVLPHLEPGRYLLTAVVRDPAKPRGERFPWVLKDDRGLLEDRRAWVLVVP